MDPFGPPTLPVTQLTLKGSTLRWPAVCVCCGQAADTTFTLKSTSTFHQKRGKVTTKGKWRGPCCTACAPHVIGCDPARAPWIPDLDRLGYRAFRYLSPLVAAFFAGGCGGSTVRALLPRSLADGLVANVLALGAFAVAAALALAGLYALGALVAWRARRSWNDHRAYQAGWSRPTTDTCKFGKRGAFNAYVLSSGTQVFTFVRNDYAIAFREANKAIVDSITVDKGYEAPPWS